MFNHLDKAADFNGWHRLTIEYNEHSVPLFRKFYSLSGNLIGTEKYNYITNQWEYMHDWRQYWRSAPRLPMMIDYGVEMLSITLINNGCDIVLRFTGVSRNTMNNSEMEAFKDYVRNYARTEKRNSQMPTNTQLTIIGVDNARHELFRATY